MTELLYVVTCKSTKLFQRKISIVYTNSSQQKATKEKNKYNELSNKYDLKTIYQVEEIILYPNRTLAECL